MFGLNGTHYLHRLYGWKLVENWVQFFNLRNIYLCTLPIPLTCAICILLMIECFYRVYTFYKSLFGKIRDSNISYQDRDRQIVLDMVLDIFFLIVPICTIYFGFKIDVPSESAIWLVLTPSLSLLSRLRRMTMAFYFDNGVTIVVKAQKRASFNMKRNRKSIFSAGYTDQVEASQNKTFPRWLKLVIFSLSLMYGLLVFVIAATHAATFHLASNACEEKLGKEYSNTIWNKGCKLQVPFCNNLFIPSCDCAVLDIQQHNMTELPRSISTLKSLQRVTIKNGPLKVLPKEIESWKELFVFDMQFNRLESFDIDVSNWKKINRIFLSYNQIQNAHESLWKHNVLKNLDINSNVGLKIPEDPNAIRLPNLRYFHAGNNSVNITAILGKEQLPSINLLYVNGNIISEFPKSFASLRTTITNIGIARCGLTRLPNGLADFKILKYIDARNNNITKLDVAFDEEKVEQYFSGNPICMSGGVSSAACEPVCTEYCYSRNSQNNYCDDTCNSAKCDYDAGDCL